MGMRDPRPHARNRCSGITCSVVLCSPSGFRVETGQVEVWNNKQARKERSQIAQAGSVSSKEELL